MVKGKQQTLLQEAISELVGQVQLHSSVVNGRIVGDFMAYLLTGDKPKANILWNNTLKARVYSTCMDLILIQEIDEYLDTI